MIVAFKKVPIVAVLLHKCSDLRRDSIYSNEMNSEYGNFWNNEGQKSLSSKANTFNSVAFKHKKKGFKLLFLQKNWNKTEKYATDKD